MSTTMQKVKSSNIDSIGYNADEKQLLVKFKSGKTFSYKYLTSPEYEALVNAESVGSHFSKFIKTTKACQEVVDKESKTEKIAEQKKNEKILCDYLVDIESHLQKNTDEGILQAKKLSKEAAKLVKDKNIKW